MADVVLDNLGPPGDAAVEVQDGVSAGATLTVLGAFLVQSVVLSAIEQCLERGLQPPLLRSSNITGAQAANARLVADYPGRLSDAYEHLRRAHAPAGAAETHNEVDGV